MLTAPMLLAAADQRRAHDLSADDALDMAQAKRVAAQIVALRRARGERTVGYKIGFTNRTIWPLYGVSHPIWGRVYDSTLTRLDAPQCRLPYEAFCEPRLEPEIVFGLRAAPASDDPRDVLAAIDWYAHGVEIVHSVYPGWKFSAAQAFAAQGLHAALLVGPVRPIGELSDPIAQLAGLSLTLLREDQPIASGAGANVLDGPVQALSHLVRELATQGETLAAGEIVTTGTLTDAMPLLPGQRWRTELNGIALAGLSLNT